jgi:DNA-binding XRE family transcriptional regulator
MEFYKFQQYVKYRCKELDISISELARQSQISRQAMHKIMNDYNVSPRLETVIAMAHALQTPAIHLFCNLLPPIELGGIEFPDYTSGSAKINGDSACFIADVTYPDNSNVPVNQTFIKIWQIQNIGDVDWDARQFICVDVPPIINVNLPEGVQRPPSNLGLKPTSTTVSMPFTKSGAIAQIAVEFTSPPYPCSVFSYWKMIDANNGEFCFPNLVGLYCHVNVIVI